MSDYTVSVPDDWQSKAEKIADQTLLSERQAEVAVLSDAGVTRQKISEELGLAVNTIDEHKQRVKRQVKQAENTLDEPLLSPFIESDDVDTESISHNTVRDSDARKPDLTLSEDLVEEIDEHIGDGNMDEWVHAAIELRLLIDDWCEKHRTTQNIPFQEEIKDMKETLDKMERFQTNRVD